MDVEDVDLFWDFNFLWSLVQLAVVQQTINQIHNKLNEVETGLYSIPPNDAACLSVIY